MEIFRSLTALALALALWWLLVVPGSNLFFPTPVPDQVAETWSLVFQPLYVSLFGLLPPLLLGVVAPRWSIILAIAFGVTIALLAQRTHQYQLAPASFLGSMLAHVLEAVVAVLAGVFIGNRLKR